MTIQINKLQELIGQEITINQGVRAQVNFVAKLVDVGYQGITIVDVGVLKHINYPEIHSIRYKIEQTLEGPWVLQ